MSKIARSRLRKSATKIARNSGSDTTISPNLIYNQQVRFYDIHHMSSCSRVNTPAHLGLKRFERYFYQEPRNI